MISKIGFGGSCHWCTEAIFQSLKGVGLVKQGWIASPDMEFSEAVIVEYDEHLLPLNLLISVHLHTHSCTSEHSMRGKYRSAVYVFDEEQGVYAEHALVGLQSAFDAPVITQVLPFGEFKLNDEQYLNYYFKDPGKPFCENIVNPKLRELLQQFPELVDGDKLNHLKQFA